METGNQPQNNKDVKPSEELEKMLNASEDEETAPQPETTGTGGNRPIFNGDSLIITKDDEEDEEETK
ncbi:MAG: hypothetical protein EOO96_11060 [Pedobacter sp.]|nr:MAG: hypothetical protein EOO96_11060 [Pedobacter sp.]